MHSHDLRAWIPEHAFNEGNPAAERRMRWVLAITATMMVVEIVAGWWFNSMALLADGWHMSSHTLAVGLSAIAYAAARKFAQDSRFTFGTWKIEVLGGFASAIFLFGIAVYMGIESVIRLTDPRPIEFTDATLIAALGLVVNVVCALIIGGAHHAHDHGGHEHALDPDDAHEQEHAHHGHHDLNLRSVYVHILADAITSILAIFALLGGKYFGLNWLDPVMGIVGGILIAVWAVNLVRDTSRVLLDCEMDRPIVGEIKAAIASLPPSGDTRIADLHVWRVGRNRYACIVSVVTDDANLTPSRVKSLLNEHEELAHVTAEVNLCPEHAHVHR
jgi:cation diffusion facilitator family transporter